MPVSPADFYAYSQATGVQVPDSPEERAQLAPQVLQFRRNQLKQSQEQGIDPVSMGVGIGLALAGAGAGALALRGRNRIPKSTKTTGQSNVKIEDLNRVAKQDPDVIKRATQDLNRFAESVEAPAATVAPSTGQASILFDSDQLDAIAEYERKSLPLPGARERAREQFARSLEAPAATVAPSTDQLSTLSETDRAEQLARLYRQQIVDREINREDKVKKEIAAMKEGAAMRVIDQLRAEAKQERIASNTSDLAAQASETAQAMAQNTLSNIQKQQAPTISDQQINAVGSGEDQMTGRVRQQLQRDEDINLMEVDVLEDINTENINMMMEEADPSQMIGYEADTPMNQAAAQTAGMVPVDQIEGVLLPMSAQEFNEKYRQQFEAQFPEELNPEIKSIPNVRARKYESENPLVEGETIESVLTGEAPVIEETMQGGKMRGGKINEAGDIIYYGSSAQYESADTGVKAKQGSGEQYKAFAQLANTMKRMNDKELYSLLSTPGAQSQQVLSKEQAQRNRLAQEILRDRAVNSLEKGYQPSPEQLDILERTQKSVAASEDVRRQYQNQRPAVSTGPEADVARAMSALRTGMEVDPSEPIANPKSYYQAWVEERGEPITGVSASNFYTGAAAEAAGPVLFTGKSKANTVLGSNPITGRVDTPTGKYRTQANPDILGTVYNVAGTPENQAIARQVEANAQQFLSNAIAGGLTLRQPGLSQQTVMPPTSGIRPKFIGPVPAKAAPRTLTQSFMPSSVEASQRTGYARYQPGVSAQAPVSPFIGEMAGGTVQPSTNLTDLQRYPDIGRTTPNLSASQSRITRAAESPVANFPSVGSMSTQNISGPLPAPAATSGPYARLQPARTSAPLDLEAPVRTVSLNPDTGLLQVQTTYDISPRAREELAARNRPTIGPLTQSPGLPRVGNIVEKDIMDTSGSEVIGRQLTAEGFPITYPRMASGSAVPFYPGKREMEKGDLRKAQMVRNIPTRQTWKLSPDYPLKLTDPQTGEQQTLYMGGGPLKRYTI